MTICQRQQEQKQKICMLESKLTWRTKTLACPCQPQAVFEFQWLGLIRKRKHPMMVVNFETLQFWTVWWHCLLKKWCCHNHRSSKQNNLHRAFLVISNLHESAVLDVSDHFDFSKKCFRGAKLCNHIAQKTHSINEQTSEANTPWRPTVCGHIQSWVQSSGSSCSGVHHTPRMDCQCCQCCPKS